MELPFTLTKGRDGRLIYGIALWYRIFAAVIFVVLATALISDGTPPSFIGWLLLLLSALGALYEERWVFGGAGAVHKVGLIFLARKLDLPSSELAGLRIVPYVRGTIPGSEDEAVENDKALSGAAEAGMPGRKLFSWKKPYLLLILEGRDGSEYALDRVPARRREALLSIAREIAPLLGIPLQG